jgi:hypothetical protein
MEIRRERINALFSRKVPSEQVRDEEPEEALIFGRRSEVRRLPEKAKNKEQQSGFFTSLY